VLNLPLIRIWVWLLKVPYSWLYPVILSLACFGIYSLSNASFDVLLGAGFGLFGYVVCKLDCPPAPFILGLVLGPMLEESVRRALLISHGDPATFVTSPISAAFLGVTVLLLALMVLPAVHRGHKKLDLEVQ